LVYPFADNFSEETVWMGAACPRARERRAALEVLKMTGEALTAASGGAIALGLPPAS
jgi:hypothetical protein